MMEPRPEEELLSPNEVVAAVGLGQAEHLQSVATGGHVLRVTDLPLDFEVTNYCTGSSYGLWYFSSLPEKGLVLVDHWLPLGYTSDGHMTDLYMKNTWWVPLDDFTTEPLRMLVSYLGQRLAKQILPALGLEI